MLGGAFGSVDGSAAYMHRLFEKGARLASPAEFPNLVPSSPVGHATIYLGIHGPALAVADLGTSGESAILRAAELIARGEADAVVAGAMEEASDIAERILTVSSRARRRERSPQTELAARGPPRWCSRPARALGLAVPVLARLVSAVAWRDDDVAEARASLSAAADGDASWARSHARVVVSREAAEIDLLLAKAVWASAPRVSCRARAGDHEAVGAVALVAGASLIARREAPASSSWGSRVAEATPSS